MESAIAASPLLGAPGAALLAAFSAPAWLLPEPPKYFLEFAALATVFLVVWWRRRTA